jgi:branched-chain amino acid transport system substrate-binding protein
MSRKVLGSIILAVLLATLTAAPGITAEKKEISIGAFMPLTGDFASYGARGRVAIEKAEADIAKFTSEANLPITIKFLYEDSETKANVTLEKIKAMAAQGVKVAVGLLDSSDIRLAMGYANANKIAMISSFSTVADLGIADDYIFRPIPHDDMEGVALAELIKTMGFSHVALLVRKDPCDLSIASSFVKEYEARGGKILERVDFAGGTKEFSGELSSLERAVKPAVEEFGAEKVAVISLTWEDLAIILSQAQARKSPLLDLTWTGGDAVAQSTVILRDAGEAAAKVSVISPMYSAPKSPKREALLAYAQEKIGETLDIYSLVAYDCAWLAALSAICTQSGDGAAIKDALPHVAANYYGASGWTDLDELGDRKALNVEFFAVHEVDGELAWVKVSEYDAATGSLSEATSK